MTNFNIVVLISIIFVINIHSHTVLSQYASGIPPFFGPRTETFLVDALSWMTLRDNGVLMDRASLTKTWMPLLKEKFLASRYYNTLVTAFELGVIPKLTLNENDVCNASYTFLYKYWYNHSVVERHVKDFIFDNYYGAINLKTPPAPQTPAALCDYRQGLVCNPASNKCECPEGSVMTPVTGSTGSSRCMLEEDEICLLVDTAAGNINDPNNPFTKFLPYALFNFEKPLGCKEGTQCRFKASDLLSPHCYSSSGSPAWVDGQPEEIPYGEPCTVGLHWKTGMCSNEPEYTDIYGGVTCYNYGLSPKNKTGICTYSYGVFGGVARRKEHEETKYNRPPSSFGVTFLTPRFIPLRGKKLQSYQADAADVFFAYVEKVLADVSFNHERGILCHVAKSKRMEEIGKYYYSLEKAPVQGSSYATDEKELNEKLKEGQSIMADAYTTTQKIVDLTSYYFYECLPHPIEIDGNDGEAKTKTTSTIKDYPAIKSLTWAFVQRWESVKKGDDTEEFAADLRIARYQEVECTPPGGGGTQCPKNYICYDDYHDYQEDQVYEDYTCNIKAGKNLKQTCHEENRHVWHYFGSCESEIMTKKVVDRLEVIFQNGYRHLAMGASCNYDVDSYVWGALMYPARVNGYHFINTDFGGHKADTDGFCDRSKLLECKKDNTCGCIDSAEPRVSNDKQYKSDYCYFIDDTCRPDLDELVFLGIDSDKADAVRHYGDPKTIAGQPDVNDADAEPACSNGNMCVFVDQKNLLCTKYNTGKTGVEPIPPSTTEYTGPGFVSTTEPGSTSKPGKTPGNGGALRPPTRFSSGTRLHSRSSVHMTVGICSIFFTKIMF